MSAASSPIASDPCSFSRPEECAVEGMELELLVDFSRRVLRGTVHLLLRKAAVNVDRVILDTRDLVIHKVYNKENQQKLSFSVSDPVLAFGSKLMVKLPISTQLSVTVSIEYETSTESTALQWLEPHQTAGKRQPYLFSQCQAVHARSMVPCQDSPAVKFPYSCKVTAPREIQILMSALHKGTEQCALDPSKIVYVFDQPIPIPSYLIAIVGGDLESRDIGPRSRVWSEKEIVDRAAYEFANTEKMLQVAESLLGPYVWGQYDLLVLPPSFPYGGMENPCLTFVTPTLLAGDRSLADVVAHEISHSWTGNLVTNSSPEHFWLNEGHTTFVERKIASRLSNQHNREQYCHLLALSGWKALKDAVDNQGADHPFTKLVPELTGVDPDDAFSSVPYEKGYAFLFYLETLVGGPEVFEPFLRAYIEKFKKQSINTTQWKDFLLSYFHDKVKEGVFDEVDWKKWFYGVGMPPVKPNYNTNLADISLNLCESWVQANEDDLSQFSLTDLKSLSPKQVEVFFNQLLLEKTFSTAKVKRMEEIYQMFTVKNSEIRHRWLLLCLQTRWDEAIPHTLQFVNEQGRMKFVRPLYKALYKWEEARDIAIKNYISHKNEMHNLTASMVAKDLCLNP